MEIPEITISMPQIGDYAPEFKAITTQGNIDFPFDYKGKWIIFFSHPADFTPVCTSEFMTFAKREPEFNALNCQLVGLSIDGLYSHIAWLRTLQTADAYDIATPADWQPGDDVIVPTAGSCGVAKDRMDNKADDVTCYDWFFCTKQLSVDQINHPKLPNA